MWGSSVNFILLLIAAASSKLVPPYKLPGTESLFLGSVDGKIYVADHSIPRNWTEAKTFCSSIGMRIASVETAAERQFLGSVDHPEFIHYYWTAGRDARTPQQFVWDHNSVSLSENIEYFNSYDAVKTCVLYSVYGEFDSFPCERATNGYGNNGALCNSY